MNTSDNSLWILSHDAVPSFLSDLAARCELWAPQPVGDGARFIPYRDDLPVELDQTPPAHPAKSVLFPNPESLFRYERTEGGTITLDPPDLATRPLVAFGVRNCDVRAIAALDAVFLHRSRPDTTYQQRRERLCLIGIACPAPGPTCFCDRMGGGPFDPTGMDIQMIPLPGGYGWRVLTDRGEEILAPLHQRLTAGSRDDISGMESSEKTGAPVDFSALKERIEKRTEDPNWDSLADACLGCGICTFVCPVCSCFSITDVGKLWGGRRVRYWDACMFSTFTREASGHNPRGAEVERVKQRFFHKFYYSIANGEPPGCVGCGRCVDKCPVSIDIRDIIAHFQPEGG